MGNTAWHALLARTLGQADALGKLSPLQKEYAKTSLSRAYMHFGLHLFSHLGVYLVTEGVALFGGMPQEALFHWLELIKHELGAQGPEWKAILEDEPRLCAGFSQSLAKRIFASESEDHSYTGMDIFQNVSLAELKVFLATHVVQLLDPHLSSSYYEELLQHRNPFLSIMEFRDQILLCVTELKENPLALLMWRIESYVNFYQPSPLLLYRTPLQPADLLQKCLALLVLFIPYEHPEGGRLLPDTPLTSLQLARAMGDKKKERYFDLQDIKGWLGSQLLLREEWERLLRQALEIGLVFRVATAPPAYGLSVKGLRIIKPFVPLLMQRIVRAATPPLTLARGDTCEGQEFVAQSSV